jgi:hypothetical protein
VFIYRKIGRSKREFDFFLAALGGTLTETYDNAGNVTDRKFSDMLRNAISVHYQYDPANQVTTITRYSDATERLFRKPRRGEM